MIQEFLRTVPLFRELDDDELAQILMMGLVKRYPETTAILTEGESGGCLHVITEGEVRISKHVPGLGEEALSILKAGDFFGEECLAGQPFRMATVSALTEGTLLVIEKREMFRLLHGSAPIADWFLSHTLARLRRIEDDLADQRCNPGEKRLARALLLLAARCLTCRLSERRAQRGNGEDAEKGAVRALRTTRAPFVLRVLRASLRPPRSDFAPAGQRRLCAIVSPSPIGSRLRLTRASA